MTLSQIKTPRTVLGKRHLYWQLIVAVIAALFVMMMLMPLKSSFSACQLAPELIPTSDSGGGSAYALNATTDEPEMGDEEEEEEEEEFPYEEVEITLPDNTLLFGKLYDPAQLSDDEAEQYLQYPLVILIHGLNGNNGDWLTLPETLVNKGYAVFAYDARGHFKSTRKTNGYKTSWRRFQNKDWKQLPRDVERIIRFFEKDEADEVGQVDVSRVALIGSKIGANTAILTAGRDLNDTIKALIALSPSLDYKGLDTTKPIINYRNPIFLMASHSDIVSYEATELLYRWALGAKAIKLFKNIGTGTDMLRNNPEIQTYITTWLARQFPATAIPQPEPFDEEEEDAEDSAGHG